MDLSLSKREALDHVQSIMEKAGLSPRDLESISTPSPPHSLPRTSILPPSPSVPHPAILSSNYIPLPACCFTDKEIGHHLYHINRRLVADAIVYHPPGAIVEYPQTGSLHGKSTAHIFAINLENFDNPKASFQYSLGNTHGSHFGVICGLLHDKSDKPVRCDKLRISCKGLKVCSEHDPEILNIMHSFVSHVGVQTQSVPLSPAFVNNTQKVVFEKTLTLYSVLHQQGCSFQVSDEATQENNYCLDSDSDSDLGTDIDVDTDYISGTDMDNLNVDSIDRSHLGLHTDFDTILQHFRNAQRRQPLPHAVCSGRMILKQDYFNHHFVHILQPQNDLDMDHACGVILWHPILSKKIPVVVVICKSPHLHPAPAPLMTPPAIVAIFKELLLDMNWGLADATPHCIMLNSGFISQSSPTLSDLHLSFANLDHVCRLINTLQAEKYPNGTSFKGVCNLMQNEAEGGQRYVRCVETHILPKGSTFHLIICMSPTMSLQLLQAVQFSINTSFKHLHKWQEFKIESWDHQHMRSVVSARAFTTSQSAEAHHILFRHIFEIAQQDTNLSVKFHHIHGCGIKAVIADGHKGQGLGLGRYCVELCQDIDDFCPIECCCQLRSLDPYDQLRNTVPADVYRAMLSLSSFEAQPDINRTLETIRNGGHKAKGILYLLQD
ncbi:hypothetical protein J3A83DRAFT_4399834 [Scleroderma citrinum]